MIARENNDFAQLAESRNQRRSFRGRSFVVHEISHDYEPGWCIIADQRSEPVLDRAHSPQRHHPAGDALANLVAEVKVGDCEPALLFMKQSEPTIEKDVFGDARGGLISGRHRLGAEIIACHSLVQSVCDALLQMASLLRLTVIAFLTTLLIGCAEVPKVVTGVPASARIQTVRTTAYTHDEGSGSRNAVGRRLASAGIKSAASDWSHFPLGTHFRIVGTKDEYMIDDYGGALVGTNTIDLYTPSRAAMHRWGVRHVQIEILHWGSDGESLHVLRPRKNTRLAKRMIASLERKTSKL